MFLTVPVFQVPSVFPASTRLVHLLNILKKEAFGPILGAPAPGSISKFVAV